MKSPRHATGRLVRAARGIAIATCLAATTGLLLWAESSQAQNAEFELNIGSLAPKGTPWMNLLGEMEKRLEEESGGRINVIVRPPGMMGEVEMVRETRRGERLQGCGVTTAAISEGGNMPELQLVELPFLFYDNGESDWVLDNVLFDHFSGTFQKRGFVLGIWSENGWRSFATKGKPIRSPDALKGFKMRSQESDVHMAMYKTFGATAIQKPMTEVLSALNSGVVDGLDNTALYIQAGGLAEPVDYFTVTKHIYQPAAIIFSKVWMDTLPPDLQKMVLGVKDMATRGRAEIREEDAAMMENFEIFDVEVVELTAAERAAFKTRAKMMHAPFAASLEGGPALLKMLNEALVEYRSKN